MWQTKTKQSDALEQMGADIIHKVMMQCWEWIHENYKAIFIHHYKAFVP